MRKATRIVVAGRPRCGKTTFALELGHRLGLPVRSTDNLIGEHEWSNASELVSKWLESPEPWVIEGVAAVRALRKWLARHPAREDGLPFTEFYWMRAPKVAQLTAGQMALGKACETIWREIRDEVTVRAMLEQPPVLVNEEPAR